MPLARLQRWELFPVGASIARDSFLKDEKNSALRTLTRRCGVLEDERTEVYHRDAETGK